MKNINVGIIGYGKMGKIYAKEINDNKKFKLIDIITKKKINQNNKLLNLFFKKKIDLVIVASPIETHFNYLKLAIKNNKNIILEKPIVKNYNQLKKIFYLTKNYKKKIFIHHNDILNLERLNFFKKKNYLQKIKRVEMNYGNYKDYINISPHIDWLPHPISIIENFFGKPNDFKIIKYKKKLKNKKVYEKLKLFFKFSNFYIDVLISNKLREPCKKILFYLKNYKFKYDGYQKKNQKTIKILLENFNKKKQNNDIKKYYNTYLTIFSLNNKLKNINSY